MSQLQSKYRASNARFGLLTINMVLFALVILEPKDSTSLLLALGFGSLNFLSMLDCLRQKALEQEKNENTDNSNDTDGV